MGPVPLEDAAARCGQGGFVWLGLFEPPPAELGQVRDAFGLHELAVEDARTFHLRPKVDLYGLRDHCSAGVPSELGAARKRWSSGLTCLPQGPRRCCGP